MEILKKKIVSFLRNYKQNHVAKTNILSSCKRGGKMKLFMRYLLKQIILVRTEKCFFSGNYPDSQACHHSKICLRFRAKNSPSASSEHFENREKSIEKEPFARNCAIRAVGQRGICPESITGAMRKPQITHSHTPSLVHFPNCSYE